MSLMAMQTKMQRSSLVPRSPQSSFQTTRSDQHSS
jgi:hypothetical protein